MVEFDGSLKSAKSDVILERYFEKGGIRLFGKLVCALKWLQAMRCDDLTKRKLGAVN